MTFETQVVDLAAGPVDLAAQFGARSMSMFIQCVGAEEIRYRETATEPALTDGGHILRTGEGMFVTLEATDKGWVWAPGGVGEVAVSPAPVRD